MQALAPYSNQKPVTLEAEIFSEGDLWIFEYRLQSHEPVAAFETESATWPSSQIPRQDQLWTTTCFEAFLKPVGLESYYEFNFSLRPAWNLYEFTGYRTPQPPQPSQAFSLEKMIWDKTRQTLQVQAHNRTADKQFETALTAVIEDSNHKKHYYALAHTGDKADFHRKDSFLLRRGSPL